MVGSCFIVYGTRAEAERFNRDDPFYAAGVWEKVHRTNTTTTNTTNSTTITTTNATTNSTTIITTTTTTSHFYLSLLHELLRSKLPIKTKIRRMNYF